MSQLDTIRSMKRTIDDMDVLETSRAATEQARSDRIDRLQEQVTALRDANTILRARVGDRVDEVGNEVARALRAAAVVIFTDHRGVRFADHQRNAVLWLKSRGWGEASNNTFHDPETRSTFHIANAIDIQAHRDLEPFKSLVNTQ